MERIARRPRVSLLLAVAAALIASAIAPSSAGAHGPLAPIASSYLARVGSVPPELDAKVIDGDQRMWLQVPAGETVVVVDYRGAPYLRFSRSGIDVNRNSAMYYLNQTPAEVPPPNLGRTSPTSWRHLGSAHQHGWHDSRLHALAGAALLPGAALAGRWSIPLLVDGRLQPISGTLWHAASPSIVWFWPIVVLLACVLAARRLRIPSVDWLVARALAIAALLAIAVGAVGRQLHGRPTVSVWQLVVLALLVAFVAWGFRRVLLRRHGYFFFFAVSVVALWEGIELLPTLLHGFVLMAVPAFLARSAAVLCLGSGAGLLLVAFRLADERDEDPEDGARPADELDSEDDRAWRLGV